MTLYRHALLIRGLQWNSGTEATLFTDGPLDASTMPAGLSPLSSSTQIAERLVPGGVSGSASIEDLRDPIVTANAPSARLWDDDSGTVAKLFSTDPAYKNTTRWVLNTTTLAASTTSITLIGTTSPTVNQVLYLGSEALKVTAVTTTGFEHACTVTRGYLGSHAKAHAVSPDLYPPGDNGQYEGLVLFSRIPFDEAKIEAALYRFRMKDSDPSAVDAAEWVWYGHVEGRPTPMTDWSWEVRIAHLAKTIKEHVFRGTKTVEISYAIRVDDRSQITLQFPGVPNKSVTLVTRPAKVAIHFSRYEFERVFNSVLHTFGANGASSVLAGTLKSRLTADSRVTYELHVEAGGSPWVFRVDELQGVSATNGTVVVRGSLIAFDPLASITSNPVEFAPSDGAAASRNHGLNEGFSDSAADKIRVSQGENRPKVSLRVRLRMTWPEAALTILLSGYGGKLNHATYDLLVGGMGLQLDPAWVNIGSTPASALTVDEGTQEWLGLAALLSEKYDYAIMPEGRAGDWFRNELTLHSSLLAFVPSTGKVASRIWARKRPASPTLLNPVVGEPIETGRRLEPLKAVILERGIHPVTLEYRHRKPLRLFGADAEDFKKALVVRIWKDGGEFTDQELATGPIARLERALFGASLGQPHLWRIPVAMDAGLVFGDLPEWTDSSIPTASGRGVTELPLIVLGLDPDSSSGKQHILALHDVVNDEAEANASAGKIVPALKVTGIVVKNSTTITVKVSSVAADTGFRIDTSHDGVWQTIADNASRVRVVNPLKHNPSTERAGLLEASATVTSVVYRASAKSSEITLEFDGAWERSSLTLDDIVVVGSRVLFQDYVPSDLNPENVTLQGDAVQLYHSGSGYDGIAIASAGRKPRIDGRRSLINDT